MTNDPSERVVLTVEEVADLLGLSRISAYKAVRTGEIPTIRLGRLYRVPIGALYRKFPALKPRRTVPTRTVP